MLKKEARLAALDAVREQGMSINDAARMFGVSRATLQRLVHDDADESTVLPKVGSPTFLPHKVEKMLAERIIKAAEQRVGVAPARLEHYARVIAKYLKIPIGKWTGGRDWRRGFCKRWGISTLKSGQTTGARLRSFNFVTVESWIAANGPVIKLFEPEEMVNVDDTSFNPEEMLGRVSNPFRDFPPHLGAPSNDAN